MLHDKEVHAWFEVTIRW